MRKPKYYLKAYSRCKTTWGIDKEYWEAMRKENKKPFIHGEKDRKNQCFSLCYSFSRSYSGTWVFRPEAMTQRYFIEEKETKQ